MGKEVIALDVAEGEAIEEGAMRLGHRRRQRAAQIARVVPGPH